MDLTPYQPPTMKIPLKTFKKKMTQRAAIGIKKWSGAKTSVMLSQNYKLLFKKKKEKLPPED